MLRAGTSAPGPDLKELVYAALAQTGDAGLLAPALEARICNSQRQGPCLSLQCP